MKKVALVYHFFAHYREPVIRSLIGSDRYDYYFVADDRDDFDGIPSTNSWKCPGRHMVSRFYFFGPIWVQPKVLTLLFKSDVSAIIMLGTPYYITYWILALLARLQKKKVIFWTHGWTKRDRGLKSLIRDSFYRLADGLMLYGENAHKIALRKGFERSKLKVIYNSLDYEAQSKIRNSFSDLDREHVRKSYFGSAFSDPLICGTARLTPICQFEVLISALAIMKKSGLRMNAIIVGDGPSKRILEDFATENDVSDLIRFVGAIYEESEVGRIIYSADFTVSPGKIGLAAIHSLGYGTPAITHSDWSKQMPEFEVIEDGVTGMLFDFGSPQSLVKALMCWIEMNQSRQLVMERCLLAVEKNWTPAAQKREIERFLDEII